MTGRNPNRCVGERMRPNAEGSVSLSVQRRLRSLTTSVMTKAALCRPRPSCGSLSLSTAGLPRHRETPDARQTFGLLVSAHRSGHRLNAPGGIAERDRRTRDARRHSQARVGQIANGDDPRWLQVTLWRVGDPG